MYRSATFASNQKRAARGQAKVAAVPAPAGRSLPYSLLSLMACLALALLLGACAQPGEIMAKSAKEKRAIAAARAQAEEKVEPKAAAVAPTVNWQDGDKLLGLGSEDIRAALGAPARIRDEEPARIYQYIGGDCVLDLFLYQAEGIYRVTYAEARSVKAEKKPVEACLRTLPSPVVASNQQPST